MWHLEEVRLFWEGFAMRNRTVGRSWSLWRVAVVAAVTVVVKRERIVDLVPVNQISIGKIDDLIAGSARAARIAGSGLSH